ncbi:cytochrome P450 3A24-like isoform X2 [Haliotis asinina]|uniref:cytochrome P450 3A24-like isoform X2 n=1 Tax=Haliotis asinina TaxID=109174 RepID=UPI00353236AD
MRVVGVMTDLVPSMDIQQWSGIHPAVWYGAGVCLLIYLYGKWRLRVLPNAGIAGPPPTIFLGNLKQMATLGIVDPCRRHRKTFGKVYGQFLGSHPFIFVHDLDILKEVFVKNFANFKNRMAMFQILNMNPYPIDMGLIFARDEAWYRLRNIMTPSFTGAKLKHMCGHINTAAESLARNLVEAAEHTDATYVKEYFMAFALDTIAATAFGIQIDSQKDLSHPLAVNAKNVFPSSFFNDNCLLLSVIFPSLKPLLKLCGVYTFTSSVVNFYRETAERIVVQRRRRPEEKKVDFLQLLLDAEDRTTNGKAQAKRLSSDEICAQVCVIFGGGFETISTSLQFMSYVLATHPIVQRKLVEAIHSEIGEEEPTYDNIQRIEYLEHFIRETLRLYPSVPLAARETASTVEIKGYTFPRGSVVVAPTLEIHRDPEYFDDPDSFDPDRWKETINPISWLPFGYGPRQCIAMRLAMVEMKIGLIHVLRRVEFVRLPDTPQVMEFDPKAHGRLAPRKAIRLKIELRQHQQTTPSIS